MNHFGLAKVTRGRGSRNFRKRIGVGNNKARNPMGDFGPSFPPEAEGHGHDSAIAGSSHEIEQRMQHEGSQHSHFVPHDLFLFVCPSFPNNLGASFLYINAVLVGRL